ncbi:MAG: patatin-like phospholipase family protein [Caulobacteraceae bacterium]
MASDPAARAAIVRLFERETEAGETFAFSLPGGAPLFLAGERAEALYLLRAGRLAAAFEEGGSKRFLGVIRPGEVAGEFSLIAGAPHSADVVALRDSELLALPRARFLAAAAKDAEAMRELAGLVVHRARRGALQQPTGEPKTFGFICVHPGPAVRPVAATVARRLTVMGFKVAVVGAEAERETTQWFSNLELAHDLLLYVGEAEESAWIGVLLRQIDRLFLLAEASARPARGPKATQPFVTAAGMVDLILLQAAGCHAPKGSAAWEKALHPAHLFHLRHGHAADIERLARVMCRRAVGLVLSGGAARAYAHVGAIRALEEAKVPIDFVAGASMGAIVAAGLAMGWEIDELDERIRRAFVESSPVDDFAIPPLVAFTHGRKVRARLAAHFGDREFADLWRPFFCLSSNLTTGAYQVHRHGLVREALTASVSLPGLLPPTISGQDVLVDGALMKNFPADVMRAFHPGPIVGVDVTRGRSIEAKDVSGPRFLWRWIASGAWRHGPPMVSILMRAATVTAESELAVSREAADLLILPEVEMIEIGDWKAYEPAVKAGEAAAREALARLDRPVTELRLAAKEERPLDEESAVIDRQEPAC